MPPWARRKPRSTTGAVESHAGRALGCVVETADIIEARADELAKSKRKTPASLTNLSAKAAICLLW